MISIPRSIHAAIVAQARVELPNECCGYLGGTREDQSRSVTSQFKMTNVDGSPEHFSFDPAEQFAALKTAREQGLELVANYHSHPETPARMSDEDIRLAHDTSIIYLIYSVSEEKLKAFTVDQARTVTEAQLQITD